jgi:hypothetical protein
VGPTRIFQTASKRGVLGNPAKDARTQSVRRMYHPRSVGSFRCIGRIPILLWVVALPAIFLIVGCAGGVPRGGQDPAPHQRGNAKLGVHPMHDSGASGTASFEDISDGEVAVKLDLRNLPKPDTLRLAHTHPGACAEGQTHEHRGSHGEEGYGHQHGGPATNTGGPATSTAAMRSSTRSRR